MVDHPPEAVDNAAALGLLTQLLQMCQQTAAEKPQPGTSTGMARSGHANFTPSRLRLPSGSGQNVTIPDRVSTEVNSDDDFEDDRRNHRSLRDIAGPTVVRKKRTRPAQMRDAPQPLQKKKRLITKEVVVIQHTVSPDVDGTYIVPAGEKMRALVASHLFGLIRFTTASSAEYMNDQIETIFGKFKHRYLKVLSGAKRMALPRTAPDMEWDGAAVLAVTGQGKLYVMAEEDVPVPEVRPPPPGGPPPTPPSLTRATEDEASPPHQHQHQEQDFQQPLQARAAICPAGHTLALGPGPCLVCSQNAEYEEGLAIDRARRLRQEAEARERQRLEDEKKEDDASAAKARAERALRVPDEPTEGLTLRILGLAGGALLRQFKASDDIQNLMDVIGSQPEATEVFAVKLNGSSTVLESSMRDSTLEDHGLSHNSVVHILWISKSELEERDNTVHVDDGTASVVSRESEFSLQTIPENRLILQNLPSSLAEVLEVCASKLSGSHIDGGMHEVKVLRDNAIDSILSAMPRVPSLTRMFVSFVSEGGEDGGGLLRELNSLILHGWQESELSNESGLGFCNNASALDDKDFVTLGRYVGTTIAQGTAGLPVFPAAVARFIISSQLGDVEPTDFKDEDVAETVLKMMSCPLSDIDDIINRVQLGCRKPVDMLTESDRGRWLRALYRQEVLQEQMPAIIDFQLGLQPMLEVWRCTPEATEAAMIFLSKDHQPQVTLAEYQNLFELNAYGDPGSQLAKEESSAYYYFNEFLADVFSVGLEVKTEAKREDLKPGEVLPPPILLKSIDVLMWFTGATIPPPGGFKNKISLHFDKTIRLPKANTCAPCASFPLDITAKGSRCSKKRYAKWILPGSGFGLN